MTCILTCRKEPAKPRCLLTVVNNQKILQYILSLLLTVLVRSGIKKGDTETAHQNDHQSRSKQPLRQYSSAHDKGAAEKHSAILNMVRKEIVFGLSSVFCIF